MRVALTHPRASDVGGVERQAHSVATALLDAGHEVHFFCQRADPGVDPRLRVHRVSRVPGAARWLKVWWFDRACARALEREGPFDLVHGFGKTSRQDVYYDGSGCLADFQGWSVDSLASPLHRRLRRASPHQRVVARIERTRYTPGNFRRILAISEMVRGQILARYGLAADDVETLYPGVDADRFRPDPAARTPVRAELGVAPGAPVAVFLGSDYRRKGLSVFLEALAALPGVHGLVIGGERPARVERLRREARAAGIGDRVHWLGVRPDPQRFLAAADVLLFPSRFDAFGSAVLEALACGVPALVSFRAGAAELVADGKTGRVLDDRAPGAAWAEAARPFLPAAAAGGADAPPGRDEARRLARAEALRHPWSQHVARVLEVGRELLAR